MSTQPREPHRQATEPQGHLYVPPQASAPVDGAPNCGHAPWQTSPLNMQGNYSQPGDTYAPAPTLMHAPARQPITRVLAYHRLSHADASTRWWSPLVEGLIGVGLYGVLSLLITVPLIIAAMKDQCFWSVLTGSDPVKSISDAAFENPWIFAYLFGSIALMFPSLWAARLWIGPKPWGLVHSVAGRMRWGWLLLCAGIAAVVFVLLPMFINAVTGAADAPLLRQPPQNLWIFIVLLLTIVPVQCYAEELVYRGYLMQTIGRWLKHPIFAIALPAPLFMIGHTYDLWGQVSVLCMGVAAGFLAWRTGGLESGIALHVVNNIIAMFGGLMGTGDPFVQQGSTFADFAVIFAIELLYVLAVLWVAKRRKLQRTREVTQ